MFLRFTPDADAAYLRIISYIAEANPIAARRFMQRVHEALARLRRFPRLGHAIPEAPDGPERQFLVGPYRFFYRVDGNKLWIVAVWHGMQIASLPSSLPSR